MKSTQIYFWTLLNAILISFIFIVRYTPATDIPKFHAPLNEVFISSYGDHDAVHPIFFHGLFNFDKKIKKADVLILGNSHAELGLSAERVSQIFSEKLKKHIKVLNLSVGWGEGFLFHKKMLKNQNVQCKMLLVDAYESFNRPFFSQLGETASKQSKMTAYSNALETWTVTSRDWLFDGIFPRFAYLNGIIVTNRYLTYPVGFRKWSNGDVWDYWFPTLGYVYRNPPKSLITYPDYKLGSNDVSPSNVELVKNIMEYGYMKSKNLKLVTTLIPTSDLVYSFYKLPMVKLNIPFFDIPFEGIELYDHYHTDTTGRQMITERLMNQLRESSLVLGNIQSLNSCKA